MSFFSPLGLSSLLCQEGLVSGGPFSAGSLGTSGTAALNPGGVVGRPEGVGSTTDLPGTLRTPDKLSWHQDRAPAWLSPAAGSRLQAKVCFNFGGKMDVTVFSKLEPFGLG